LTKIVSPTKLGTTDGFGRLGSIGGGGCGAGGGFCPGWEG